MSSVCRPLNLLSNFSSLIKWGLANPLKLMKELTTILSWLGFPIFKNIPLCLYTWSTGTGQTFISLSISTFGRIENFFYVLLLRTQRLDRVLICQSEPLMRGINFSLYWISGSRTFLIWDQDVYCSLVHSFVLWCEYCWLEWPPFLIHLHKHGSNTLFFDVPLVYS